MSDQEDINFPGKEWEIHDPAESGLELEPIKEIGSVMEQARSNGVLIHRGYLVAEWTYDKPVGKRFNIQSCTKAITSAVLGLALKDGLIPHLDARVKKHYPAFDAGPYTDEITFRHLVTATSGIPSRISPNLCKGNDYLKPGTVNRYNSDHFQYLALALTHLFEANLMDVVRDNILSHLQIQDGFAWESHDGRGGVPKEVTLANGKTIPTVAGYFNSLWSARDLARMGYLYLRGGQWEGEQILPADYVRECREPIPFPVLAIRPETPDGAVESNARYGLAWRGLAGEDGRIIWNMSGYGGQFCAVLPEYDLVMTKVKNWQHQPHIGIERFESALWDLVQRA